MNKEQIQAAAKAAYEQCEFELAERYPESCSNDEPWDNLHRDEQAAWIAAIGAAWEVLDKAKEVNKDG